MRIICSNCKSTLNHSQKVRLILSKSSSEFQTIHLEFKEGYFTAPLEIIQTIDKKPESKILCPCCGKDLCTENKKDREIQLELKINEVVALKYYISLLDPISTYLKMDGEKRNFEDTEIYKIFQLHRAV